MLSSTLSGPLAYSALLAYAALIPTIASQATTLSAPSYEPSAAIAVPVNPTDAVTATQFALLYGAPIAAFVQLARPILETQGANNISFGQALSSPYSQAVVRPNGTFTPPHIVAEVRANMF